MESFGSKNETSMSDSDKHSESVSKRQKEKEESSAYHFIVWNVAKYKSLMRGVSEGFYDTPTYLDDE